MRLLNITATAHRDGNRIDLAWAFPKDPPFPGVRVVRREGTHPISEHDGFVVAHGIGITGASDTGLKGEHVYYYALYPFTGDPPNYDVPDAHNQGNAMAISPYDFAGQLYALLPAIYRRFDTGTAAIAEGQLRRFLDLPGGELDRLYSFTRAALSFADLDRVDGKLLPLLAQWIGWRTNFGLPVDRQRNEIRYAPRFYQSLGAVPTLDATVARVSGWGNQTKEFVHNVARSNQPERLNLWSAVRGGGGAFGTPQLASVNFGYDGRPAAVTEADGSVLVFFHTLRQHGWDIWSKRYTTADGWQPSQPVVDRPGIDKHPAVARQGDQLCLFWQSYDPDGDRRWHLNVATRTGSVWSAPALLGDLDTERRLPAAVADNTGGVWLFWLERISGAWQLRYNRHTGTDWQQLTTTAATLPLDGGQQPRVEDDVYVLFHPTRSNQRLWLFWARRDPGGPAGQTRWTVVYRIKQGLDPAAADWSAINALPRATSGYHDRQPTALLAGNDLEVFWSSTQHGGWSTFRNTLATAGLTWGTAEQISTGAYTDSGPLAVPVGAGTLLAYRSNQSIAYDSATFGATHTLDNRYAGTSTVDTSAADKLEKRGKFDDFLTYTYDTGTAGDSDRISRHTVGLYINRGDGDSPAVTAEAVSRLAGELADFVPATTRTVIITP